MKSYIFFSVHEELFTRIEGRLANLGVDQHTGFVWSDHQRRYLEQSGTPYDPVVVFTRDLLPLATDGN